MPASLPLLLMLSAASPLGAFGGAPSGGLSDAGQCPLRPVGRHHPVEVSRRTVEPPRGCVSNAASRGARGPEVHVVVLERVTSAESPAVVTVALRSRGLQRRRLVLVLVTAPGHLPLWRLSASGMNSDLINSVHVSSGALLLCVGDCLRHNTFRDAPAPAVALEWALRRYVAVTSYSAVRHATILQISLGHDPSWPPRCEPRPDFLSPAVEAFYLEPGQAAGCSERARPGPVSQTHIIELQHAAHSGMQTEAVVHVRSSGSEPGLAAPHLALLLLGPDTLHWVVHPHGIVGRLTVLAGEVTVRHSDDDGAAESDRLLVTTTGDRDSLPPASVTGAALASWARSRSLPPTLSYTAAASGANHFELRLVEPDDASSASNEEESTGVAAATTVTLTTEGPGGGGGGRGAITVTTARGEPAAPTPEQVPVAFPVGVPDQNPAPGFYSTLAPPTVPVPPPRLSPPPPPPPVDAETSFSVELFRSERFLHPVRGTPPRPPETRVFVQVSMTSRDPVLDFSVLWCAVSAQPRPVAPSRDSNPGREPNRDGADEERQLIRALCPAGAGVTLHGTRSAPRSPPRQPPTTHRRFSFDASGDGGGGGGGGLRFLHCQMAPCVANATRTVGGLRMPRCLHVDEACGQEGRPLFDVLTSAPVTSISLRFLLPGNATPSGSPLITMIIVVVVAVVTVGAALAAALCLWRRRRDRGSVRVATDCGANNRNNRSSRGL